MRGGVKNRRFMKGDGENDRESIKRIIIHIPEYQFKTIRYYGFYSKKSKFHDKMIMLVHPKKLNLLKSLINVFY